MADVCFENCGISIASSVERTRRVGPIFRAFLSLMIDSAKLPCAIEILAAVVSPYDAHNDTTLFARSFPC